MEVGVEKFATRKGTVIASTIMNSGVIEKIE